MIFVNIFGLLLGLLSGISGTSYSKVFVQSGSDIVPVDYLKYGAPFLGPQVGQLSAAPVGSVVPVSQVPSSVFAPCVAPCVIARPPQPTENARLVTYKSPSVPVAVSVKEEPAKYEYSYVVYDENTGDQKAQQEFSEDGVVRGQYSLIQPDGYVREVQYTADDLKGFNAIVKNFLPEDSNKNVDKKDTDPCGKPKEDLQEEPKTEIKSEDAETLEVLPKEEKKEPPKSIESNIQPVQVAVVQPPQFPIANLPGYDLSKCLQIALRNQAANQVPPSLLTYILIPSTVC